MLQKTVASASTTAAISSGEVTGSLGDVDEDLVGLDHAQLRAGLLFDHLEAFLQVSHFVREAFVGLLRVNVRELLRIELALQGGDRGEAAPPEPQLRVHDDEQQDEDGGDDA